MCKMQLVSRTTYIRTTIARKDAVATIIFRSGKMRRLFEVCMHAHTVCIIYSASVVSQVDEALCFDSIVCGHHICKAVRSPQKAE